MDFNFTEEQSMLRDTVASYLADNYSFDQRKGIIGSEAGWSPKVWKAFAEELGILGAPFFCFHDHDVRPEGASLGESRDRLNRIADLMDRALASDIATPTYPPYNIEHRAPDGFRITLAVEIGRAHV